MLTTPQHACFLNNNYASLKRQKNRRLLTSNFLSKVDVRTGNEGLDTLTGLDIHEGLLGISEGNDAGDQSLSVDLLGGNELKSELVVTRTIAERATDSDLLAASSSDGEVDVVTAHTALDVVATVANNVDTNVNAGLGTRGINDNISTTAEVELLDHLLSSNGGVDLLGDVEVSGETVLDGELSTSSLDIDNNDLGSTEGLGDTAAKETNGTSTEDNDAVTGLNLTLLGNVNGNTERLHDATLLNGHGLGELVAVVLRKNVVLGESTVIWGSSSELHVEAQVVLAILAGRAAAAGDTGLEGNLVANLKAGDSRADLGDDTGRLVAKDHRASENEVTNGTVLPVVNL